MKLRNKKTGEILEIDDFCFPRSVNPKWIHSLEELNENWEDVEEPKNFQYITADGDIDLEEDDNSIFSNNLKEIGNYFETKEEAEKAIDKLKAWKRLKDWGFEFCGEGDERNTISFTVARPPLDMQGYWTEEIHKCFDLLFGGEE